MIPTKIGTGELGAGYSLYNTDNSKMLSIVKPNTVDLVVTSTPYKNSDGFTDSLMQETFANLHYLQKPNTLFFLNFGHLAEDKFRPFHVCELAMEAGYVLAETFVWIKNHYRPIQGARRVNNLTEFVFMLYKGRMPKLDRLAVGIPYADKSNIGRFAKSDLKCSGNVWPIPYETIQSAEDKLHNDRYPVELPERCMKICAYPVNVVLDPFVGSGTTVIAGLNQGKHVIGFEKQKSNFLVMSDRIDRYVKKMNFIITGDK